MRLERSIRHRFLNILLFIVYTKALEPNMHDNQTTSCEDFGRFARFNPYSVLEDEWMLFYYWGPIQPPMFVKFSIPEPKQLAYLKYILSGHVLEQVDWSARLLLMIERDNSTYFLVEQGDRGQYHLYVPRKALREGDIINAVELRIKQTGDNRYIGIMNCETQIVFAFSRTIDAPKKLDIQDAAARIGFRGRGGRSYLYQGHQWMPIPEADDDDFEAALKYRDHNKRYI